MPTLLERMHALSTKITALASAKMTEDEAKVFAARAQELKEVAVIVSALAQRVELLASKGIRMQSPPTEPEALKRVVDELATKYVADPRNILAPDTTWRYATRNQLKKLPERFNPSMLTAWQAYIRQLTPDVDQGLVRALLSSPAHAAYAKRVQEKEAELALSAQRLPDNRQELDRPEQLARELHDVLQKLPNDIPQVVQELFLAIGLGTATADDLVSLPYEEMTWLKDKRLLSDLHISWRPS